MTTILRSLALAALLAPGRPGDLTVNNPFEFHEEQ